MKDISRREFIATSCCLLPTLNSISSKSFQQSSIINKLGLQLGCVQGELVSQPQQTLEYIYSLGLRHIELPEIGLLKRLHPVLTGMGFKVHSSHFASPYITKNWEPYTAFGNAKPRVETFSELIEEAAEYQLSYLVFPDIFPQDRGDLNWYQSFSEQLNEAGEACKAAGIQLCYHNHNFEFQPVENTSPFEVMLDILKPELVKFELDIFWLSIAGVNVQEFIKKHQNQIALLHLGDLGTGAPQSYRAITLPEVVYQPLGKGNIDFKSIVQSRESADIPYYFLNLEKSEDIFADLKISVDYLKIL